MDDDGERRKARNEAAFRDANERIEEARVDLGLGDGRTPFLCECEDTACHDVLLLTLEEYERVRSRPTWFVVVAGHHPDGREVVEARDGWAIVAKTGTAAEVARETDPRG